jgi:hypothetical protein
MSTYDDALARAREINERGRAELLARTGTAEVAAEEWRRRHQHRDERPAIIAAEPEAFSNRPTTPRPTWALSVAEAPTPKGHHAAALERAAWLREQHQARADAAADPGFWSRHLRPAPRPVGRMPTFDIIE